jgi:hypothetical protein
MPDSESRYREPLLVERIASLCGFEWLAGRLPGPDVYPPYLFAGVFLFLDFGVVNVIKYWTGNEHILLKSPTVVAGPLGLVLAAVGLRYMANGYARAMATLKITERDVDAAPESLAGTFALRTKAVVYVLAVLGLYAHIFLNVGVGNILAFEGPAGLINQLVIWEVAYMPFVVEFGMVYFGIHVVVPRRLRRAGIGLFYYDPRNMGGFAPFGQLLKRSYYLFTGGLLLFFVLTYGPFVLAIGESAVEPGVTEALFFSAAWLVGVLSIGHSMLAIHRIMAGEKERRIRDLEAELREIIEDPYDITEATVTDQERLADVYRRLEEVRATRVYPATFTMWSQIAVSVLLPQALQMAVSATA